MSKKLLRGSNPWDELKAVCLGNFKGSAMLQRKAQDMHKPHNPSLEGLLPSQKQLNKSWRGQHHNCQAQPFTEPSRKRQTVQENRPSNKTKQEPHQPQHPGHPKCSPKIIRPCNCTDLRTPKGSSPCSRPGPAPLLAFSRKQSPRSAFVQSPIKGMIEQGHEHEALQNIPGYPLDTVILLWKLLLDREANIHETETFLEGKLFSQVTQALQCLEWNWDSEERHIMSNFCSLNLRKYPPV